MKREILVDVTPLETRVAVAEDNRLVEIFHERRRRQGLVGNIYLGRIHRVLPGIQAAFVSIGLERDAFLYVEDILPRPVDWDVETDSEERASRRPRDSPRLKIDDLVKEGQQIVVQVTKDAMSGKGPRVTANFSLPGRLLVHLPRIRQIAVSRRIADEAERERLRRIIEALPAEGGFIARTAALGCSPEEFETDRLFLTDLAARIGRKAQQANAPLLLHAELDLPLRVVRDLATADVAAIRVEDEGLHARLAEFLATAAPVLLSRLEMDQGPRPLFERFGIEAEIERALESHVMLPSGGSVVIHQTEALVAIDVNTGKFVGKDALEETVFETNLEAIPEIARQIRLRDLGGLLVVDFIDMIEAEHRAAVFDRFEAELAVDRARTRVLQISDFGLVEITRQRSRENLERALTRVCPDCDGTGRVKTDLSVALDIRRAVEKSALLYASGETVRVRVRPSLALLIQEEEPDLFADISRRFGIQVALVADSTLPAAGFEILSK